MAYGINVKACSMYNHPSSSEVSSSRQLGQCGRKLGSREKS